MKQFEEGVKHKCTLHFVYITLGIPTQFGFLQHPLFSVNVAQCLVASLLFILRERYNTKTAEAN